MALIINSECVDIKDGACTTVCPVDCIYEGGRMFYIHPDECIECGICESICPVDAIRYDDEVSEDEAIFVQINREYFEPAVTGLGEPGGWNRLTTTDQDHPAVLALPRKKKEAEISQSKEEN
ncbi:ferredoxin family protein [Sneathiella marina]|uniref:Ferredoxin n=1 Tax=Sneathiella marina TaxID=2950108 RepID=A0ABY4W486_9PROT|nr:ferredoxin [Sneathiella marina]USG62015.1 ferredoxin family protein [Sneathiella marina]